MSNSGSQTTPCQRSAWLRLRWFQKKNRAAPSAANDTMMDFSVS